MWRQSTTGIALLVGPLTMGMAGCIAFPHPAWAYDERPGIGKSVDVSFIRPGVTTRREVLLRLGEPDWVGRANGEDRLLTYCWSTSSFESIGLIPSNSPRSGGIITMSGVTWHRLEVEFDEQGRATRHGVRDEKLRMMIDMTN